MQRYLTAKSISTKRRSLMLTAYVKIPLQLLILAAGVLVFVFYLFQPPPMLFNRVHDAEIAAGPQGAQYSALQQSFDREIATRKDAATRDDRPAFLASDARLKDIRTQAAGVVRQATGDERYNDVNYVFPTFITTHMPIGLVGLMIAAIFAAAMSASGGELNALATATVIDFYRRYAVKEAPDSHYLLASKLATTCLGAGGVRGRDAPRIKARSSRS